MDRRATIKLNVTGAVAMGKVDDEWVGYMEPFALTLRGKTKEDVTGQVTEALAFFLSSIAKAPNPERTLFKYCDRHGINYSVLYEDDGLLPFLVPDEIRQSESFQLATGLGEHVVPISG